MRARGCARRRRVLVRGESRIVFGGSGGVARGRRRDARVARGPELRRRRAPCARAPAFGARSTRGHRRGACRGAGRVVRPHVRHSLADGRKLGSYARCGRRRPDGSRFGLPAHDRGRNAARREGRARRARRARRGLPGMVHGGGEAAVRVRRHAPLRGGELCATRQGVRPQHRLLDREELSGARAVCGEHARP